MVAPMTPYVRGLGLVVVLLAAPAVAENCPSRAGAPAATRSNEARLKFLSAELRDESARAYTWRHAWAMTYGVLTIVQIAAVPLIIPVDQVEWWVAAATTAVGAAFVIIDPLEVLEAGPPYAQRAPAADDVCAVIAEGEGLLERSASEETTSRRWYMHAANVVFNLGIGLILGLGYGHWVAGAVNVALGVAIGEVTIFTSPNRLISAWSEYQRGELGEKPSPVAFRVFPLVHPGGAGLGVSLTF
jgi:hypothetical protein